MGLRELVYWSIPLSDVRRGRWITSVCCQLSFIIFLLLNTVSRRRTHQSGPLGELFDHGVDALNTSLEVLVFAAAMKFGQGWKTILVLFGSLITFYVQTWDEYHTKTLTLGIVSGPVEGILTLCIVYAFTAIKGGDFWQQSLLASIGVEKHGFIPDAVYKLAWNEWYLYYGGVVLLFNTVQRYAAYRSPTWQVLTGRSVLKMSCKHAALVANTLDMRSLVFSHSSPPGY